MTNDLVAPDSKERKSFRDVALINVTAVYMFVDYVFLLYTNRVEKSYLAFGGFAFSIGIYGFCRTSVKTFVFDDPTFWGYVELGSLYLTPVYICKFCDYLFSKSKYNYLNFAAWLIGGYSAIAFVATIFTDRTLWDFLAIRRLSQVNSGSCSIACG